MWWWASAGVSVLLMLALGQISRKKTDHYNSIGKYQEFHSWKWVTTTIFLFAFFPLGIIIGNLAHLDIVSNKIAGTSFAALTFAAALWLFSKAGRDVARRRDVVLLCLCGFLMGLGSGAVWSVVSASELPQVQNSEAFLISSAQIKEQWSDIEATLKEFRKVTASGYLIAAILGAVLYAISAGEYKDAGNETLKAESYRKAAAVAFVLILVAMFWSILSMFSSVLDKLGLPFLIVLIFIWQRYERRGHQGSWPETAISETVRDAQIAIALAQLSGKDRPIEITKLYDLSKILEQLRNELVNRGANLLWLLGKDDPNSALQTYIPTHQEFVHGLFRYAEAKRIRVFEDEGGNNELPAKKIKDWPDQKRYVCLGDRETLAGKPRKSFLGRLRLGLERWFGKSPSR